MDATGIGAMTLTEARDAVRRGEVTARALAEAALDALATWQKHTNAGSNWFRENGQPESIWFLASGGENGGNLAFELVGVTPPPGDYNLDFAVNPTDYNLWNQQFGATTQPAIDGNLDGVVNAADYIVWRKQLGTAVGSSDRPSVAVPEPSFRLITAAMVLGLAAHVRVRRSNLIVSQFQLIAR